MNINYKNNTLEDEKLDEIPPLEEFNKFMNETQIISPNDTKFPMASPTLTCMNQKQQQL